MGFMGYSRPSKSDHVAQMGQFASLNLGDNIWLVLSHLPSGNDCYIAIENGDL